MLGPRCGTNSNRSLSHPVGVRSTSNATSARHSHSCRYWILDNRYKKHDINYNLDINREGRAYNATVFNTSSRELHSSYNMLSSGSIKGTEYGQEPNCPREG